MKKNNQKGFTLSEVLTVVFIVSILISISFVAVNCSFKYIDFEEASVNGSQIMTSLEGIYSDTGKIPVSDNVTIDELDKEVLKSLKEDIPKIEEIIKSNNLYKLNSNKLSFRGDLNKSDVENFYVIYVKDLSNKEYLKYNLTLVSKFYCSTCSDASFSHILGKSPYDGVSEGLLFELDDNYLSCPNSGLSFKLGDECEEENVIN